MLPAIALSLALFAVQAPTPAAPPSDPSASQPVPASRPCGLDAMGQYHNGCGVTAPRLVNQVYPEYSKEARKKKFNGIVLVGLTVDANGEPTNLHIVRSASDKADEANRDAALSLDQKALDCVQKYRFAPATYQGKPVPFDLNVEVNFQIVK